MQKTFTLPAALAALTVLGASALAQTPPPPPVHHGIFSKLFHPKPKPGQPATGSFGRPRGVMPGHSGMMPMHGGVIANKNSRVYHLPGDKGALPAPQNRVYFPTAAAAEAAGYHRAGGARSTTSRPKMQGSPMHGMPGGMSH